MTDSWTSWEGSGHLRGGGFFNNCKPVYSFTFAIRKAQQHRIFSVAYYKASFVVVVVVEAAAVAAVIVVVVGCARCVPAASAALGQVNCATRNWNWQPAQWHRETVKGGETEGKKRCRRRRLIKRERQTAWIRERKQFILIQSLFNCLIKPRASKRQTNKKNSIQFQFFIITFYLFSDATLSYFLTKINLKKSVVFKWCFLLFFKLQLHH